MSPPANEARPAGSEWWVRAAYALLLVEFVGLLYLGSRPAGRAPLLVYMLGPFVLGALALLCGGAGLLLALVRRPFLQRGRMVGWFAVGVVIATASYPFPFPARRAGRPSAVQLQLPVEGAWRVRWGGIDSDRNLPARARPDRRYGYELVSAAQQELAAPHTTVFAPCDGRVLAVGDLGLIDGSQLSEGLVQFVVLEIAPAEFLFLAGLEGEGLLVAEGDAVARGEPMARFSGPGRSLILYLQDTPEPVWGQGIPFVFDELLVNGQRRERAQPRGQSVRDPARQPGDLVERLR